jgi:hypothetical protein
LYLTTIGTPTTGTVATNTSGYIRKIAVNTTGFRICMLDQVNNRLNYISCTSAPYGGTTFNNTITLGTNARPSGSGISGITFLPDGSSGLFFIVVASGQTVHVGPAPPGGFDQPANTVYSMTNLESPNPTLTPYTVNASTTSPNSNYYQYLLFTSSTAGYAVVLNLASGNGYYIVIAINTSTSAITTTPTVPTLLGNGGLNASYKPGFYSDALNTAVFLSPSGTSSTSQGLFAFQPQY